MARNNRDPNRPDGRVIIRDFLGYQPNLDAHDLPAGVATVQVNAASQRPGELRVRSGYAVVMFDS